MDIKKLFSKPKSQKSIEITPLLGEKTPKANKFFFSHIVSWFKNIRNPFSNSSSSKLFGFKTTGLEKQAKAFFEQKFDAAVKECLKKVDTDTGAKLKSIQYLLKETMSANQSDLQSLSKEKYIHRMINYLFDRGKIPEMNDANISMYGALLNTLVDEINSEANQPIEITQEAPAEPVPPTATEVTTEQTILLSRRYHRDYGDVLQECKESNDTFNEAFTQLGAKRQGYLRAAINDANSKIESPAKPPDSVNLLDRTRLLNPKGLDNPKRLKTLEEHKNAIVQYLTIQENEGRKKFLVPTFITKMSDKTPSDIKEKYGFMINVLVNALYAHDLPKEMRPVKIKKEEPVEAIQQQEIPIPSNEKLDTSVEDVSDQSTFKGKFDVAFNECFKIDPRNIKAKLSGIMLQTTLWYRHSNAKPSSKTEYTEHILQYLMNQKKLNTGFPPPNIEVPPSQFKDNTTGEDSENFKNQYSPAVDKLITLLYPNMK